MRYRTPEELKESGIEWIGPIPVDWGRSRLRYYTKCLDGRRIPLNSEERSRIKGEIPYWGANGVVDHINDYLFDDELILLGEDGAPFFDKYKDVAFKVTGKVWVNNHIHVLLPKNNINIDFLTSYLNTVNYSDYIWGSTRDKLNQSVMGGIPVILPPLPEQRAIATFLDRKTEAIDRLIEKKEHLIRRLKEKRQALITRAVTKGLDPDVPMKDSGIEWLGEIPEHWEILKLKYFFQLQRGHDLTQDNFKNGEYPVCGSNGVIGYHNEFTTEGPGVTVGRSGSVGEVNFIDHNFWAHNTCLHVYKTFGNPIKYIYYILIALDLKSYSEGSAVGTLNRNYLHPLYIAVPRSKKEQYKIIHYLDRELKKLSKTIDTINGQIQKLKEYRQSLISTAVTGKIDVRDEVPDMEMDIDEEIPA